MSAHPQATTRQLVAAVVAMGRCERASQIPAACANNTVSDPKESVYPCVIDIEYGLPAMALELAWES